MQHYIETIEQINKDGVISEYGATEKVADKNMALNKYYTKLANVSADLGKSHTYMNIKLVDSQGSTIKADVIGKYEEVTE